MVERGRPDDPDDDLADPVDAGGRVGGRVGRGDAIAPGAPVPVVPVDPDLDPADPGQPDDRGLGRPGRPRRPRRARPDVLAAVAAGGMVGASARHALAEWLPAAPGRFPWATFWTNLSGSFLLGLFLVLLLERLPPTRHLRPFVATGVFGAFTTMSTYQVETALLVRDGHPLTAALYAVGSLAAGVVLAYAGMRAARRATPPRTAVGR
jgi:CrcB protein